MSLDSTLENAILADAPQEAVAPVGVPALTLDRIYPEQLPEKWEAFVLPAVRVGLGVQASKEEAVEGAFFALKSDILRAYLIVGRPAESGDQKAVLGTVIVGRNVDVPSNTLTLHIWSLYANGGLGISEWRTGLEAIRRVKEEMGCVAVTAQTNSRKLCELVKALGGKAEAVLLRLEV